MLLSRAFAIALFVGLSLSTYPKSEPRAERNFYDWLQIKIWRFF